MDALSASMRTASTALLTDVDVPKLLAVSTWDPRHMNSKEASLAIAAVGAPMPMPLAGRVHAGGGVIGVPTAQRRAAMTDSCNVFYEHALCLLVCSSGLDVA